MKRSQIVGLFLWRTGLLIAGSYGVFRVVRLAWQHVDLPAQLEWGLGLATTGAVLVAGSFIAERVVDQRAEGSLAE